MSSSNTNDASNNSFSGPFLTTSELDDFCDQSLQQSPQFFHEPTDFNIGEFDLDTAAQESSNLWYPSAEQYAAGNIETVANLDIDLSLDQNFEFQGIDFSGLPEDIAFSTLQDLTTTPSNHVPETLDVSSLDTQQNNNLASQNDPVSHLGFPNEEAQSIVSSSKVAMPGLPGAELGIDIATTIDPELDLYDPNFWDTEHIVSATSNPEAGPSESAVWNTTLTGANFGSNLVSSMILPTENTNTIDPHLFDTSSTTQSDSHQARPVIAFDQPNMYDRSILYNQPSFPNRELLARQSHPSTTFSNDLQLPQRQGADHATPEITEQQFNLAQQSSNNQMFHFGHQSNNSQQRFLSQQQPLFGRTRKSSENGFYGEQGLYGNFQTGPYPYVEQQNAWNFLPKGNGEFSYGGTPSQFFQPAMLPGNYQGASYIPTQTFAPQHYVPNATQQFSRAMNVEEQYSPPVTPRTTGTSNRNQVYKAEKPRKDPLIPHHRINHATKGKSTRSGKINSYNSQEHYQEGLPHPFDRRVVIPNVNGEPADVFEFNDIGTFKKKNMSARNLERFILHHPVNGNARLVLWIQKTPADSSRRYPHDQLSKCRISECPGRKNTGDESSSITVGDFRVGLDQFYTTYGDIRDPCHCAGYIHLYCAERFFDWPSICQQADVRADTRELEREPRGKWSAAIGDSNPNKADENNEANAANAFIQSCRNNTFQQNFPTYVPRFGRLPVRYDMYIAATRSLNFQLMDIKIRRTSRGKIDLLLGRGAKLTHSVGNFGDIQVKQDAQNVQKHRNVESLSRKDDLDRFSRIGQEKLTNALPPSYQRKIHSGGFEAFIRSIVENKEASKAGREQHRDSDQVPSPRRKRSGGVMEHDEDEEEYAYDDNEDEEDEEEEPTYRDGVDGDYVPPNKRRRTRQ